MEEIRRYLIYNFVQFFCLIASRGNKISSVRGVKELQTPTLLATELTELVRTIQTYKN